ncbi:Phosphotyrosyl phosphatase activator [Patellaria atrata CBS 101060]|uniref:Serine/threonine-protein phosphatase 2A activator n=1 Tax=Patellaria atrata CBS 101060 TaxID=1346257 RepID=A0A9P4SB86_9PEZI|nr:Phosphotyrosyl phosphatase activator [Patellaria atrata CBS 101060]
MTARGASKSRSPSNSAPDIPRLVPRSRPKSSPSPKEPAPETPPLPPPPALEGWKFVRPSRRILSQRDHDVFISSPTYILLTSFVFTLCDCVRDTPISSIKPADLDPAVTAILNVLDEADEVLKRCPPEDTGGSRFGNKAFRVFLERVEQAQESWHRKLSVTDSQAVQELSAYLLNAFGNGTRIDYGSGHELNFILWLLCLNRLSKLPQSTFPSLVLCVFTRYLRLMRSIQSTYYLEPAGSHGVWGLDDYQFLPFLFGAGQLYHHPFIRPKSIHQSMVLEEYSKDYLYLDQVSFVNSVKNVEGLRWHSPMLDDISASKNWAKIEGGMRKMFVKEVLGKLPVMQHFLFGSLIPAVEGMSTEEQAGVANEEEETEGGEIVVMKDGMKHVHNPSSWGDCCGIKVPSSVGAMQEMRKRMGVEGLRRVPFD